MCSNIPLTARRDETISEGKLIQACQPAKKKCGGMLTKSTCLFFSSFFFRRMINSEWKTWFILRRTILLPVHGMFKRYQFRCNDWWSFLPKFFSLSAIFLSFSTSKARRLKHSLFSLVADTRVYKVSENDE